MVVLCKGMDVEKWTSCQTMAFYFSMAAVKQGQVEIHNACRHFSYLPL